MRVILLVVVLLFSFNTYAGQDFPDLLDIKHISAKGRVQDIKYNPNNPIIAELIKNGKASIPYLIDRLDSERPVNPGVFDFWPYIEERHLALRILSDFFLDPTWEKTSLPDMCYITILEITKYPELAEWDILREHFTPNKWKSVKEKWVSLWREHENNIYWDPDRRFFLIQGAQLKSCD